MMNDVDDAGGDADEMIMIVMMMMMIMMELAIMMTMKVMVERTMMLMMKIMMTKTITMVDNGDHGDDGDAADEPIHNVDDWGAGGGSPCVSSRRNHYDRDQQTQELTKRRTQVATSIIFVCVLVVWFLFMSVVTRVMPSLAPQDVSVIVMIAVGC